MALGKGKILRYARLYAGGYDLSGDARTLSSCDNTFDEIDMTGWANENKQYLAGFRMVGIRGFQSFLNTAAGGAYTVLKDAPDAPISVAFGSNAIPVAGNAAYLIDASQLDTSLSFDAGAGLISGDFLQSSAGGTSAKNPLGYVLLPLTSLASTTNGTTVDTESGTTADGYSANLHVTVTSSGDFAFTIEDSPNGSAWATLASFTIDGSSVESEHISGTGSVDRYIRFVATRTAGTISAVCTFARNSYAATA